MTSSVTHEQPGERRHTMGVRRVARRHLVGRLDDLFEARAGVVHGPAGSGKTTLVQSWADTTRSTVVAYLCARPEHRDTQLFAADILESVRSTGPIEDVVSAADWPGLIEWFRTIDRRIVVVIDEVETLYGSGSSSLIDGLISGGGESLRVLAVGRAVEGLELGELRMNNELVEITPADLRLTSSETIDLVRSLSGTDADDGSLAAVHEQIAGWVAGAVLAGLALRDAEATDAVLSDLAGHHHFDRFLDRYVFAELPLDMQSFLLDTCILDPLLPDQCRELTGRNDAEQLLRWLARRNVFTEWTGGDPRAYRYHPLMRSWLLGRLPMTRARELGRRAAGWCRQSGRAAEAIEYLLHARDVDAAIEAIVEYGPQALAEGRYEGLVEWIGALPSSLVASNPSLLAILVEAGHRTGDQEVPALVGTLTENLLEERSDDTPSAQTRLTMSTQRGREMLFDGRLTSAGDQARRSLAIFDPYRHESPAAAFAAEDLIVASNINSCATQLLFAGHLAEAVRASEWVIDTFEGPKSAQIAVVANAIGKIALCELLRRERKSARERARTALSLCRFHRIDPVDLGWAECALVVAGTEPERSSATFALQRRLRRMQIPAYTGLGGLASAWSHVLADDLRVAQLDLDRAQCAIASMSEPAMLGTLARRVARIVEHRADEPVLSERQRVVLGNLAAGRSRREVAHELHISLNTVKTYARLAYRSLGASSLREAVAICADLGIPIDLVDADKPNGSVGPPTANWGRR